VLGGLAAAALPLAAPAAASTLLAGCGSTETPARRASTHPALRPPRDEAVVAVIAVPPRVDVARSTLAALASRVRAANGTGLRTSAMLALGHTWFAKAGLESSRPPQVGAMPEFPGDQLDPLRVGGDLLVQLEGDTRPIAERGMAELLAGLTPPGGAVVRWRAAGRRPENQVVDGRPLTRNAAGFLEGFGNPDAGDGSRVDDVTLVRAGSDVPPWVVGGMYLVLRVIRLDREAWAAEPPAEQETIIGRRTDGRWLDGTPTDQDPDFGKDPYGWQTPLESHVRLANPKGKRKSAPPLVRRSWTYAVEPQANVVREQGSLFMCYQSDIGAGFDAVRKRLRKQKLAGYVTPLGGGYFAVPPPDPVDGGWEQALLR
jgi:deferrochelatase/peroxidase EfeB